MALFGLAILLCLLASVVGIKERIRNEEPELSAYLGLFALFAMTAGLVLGFHVDWVNITNVVGVIIMFFVLSIATPPVSNDESTDKLDQTASSTGQYFGQTDTATKVRTNVADVESAASESVCPNCEETVDSEWVICPFCEGLLEQRNKTTVVDSASGPGSIDDEGSTKIFDPSALDDESEDTKIYSERE